MNVRACSTPQRLSTTSPCPLVVTRDPKPPCGPWVDDAHRRWPLTNTHRHSCRWVSHADGSLAHRRWALLQFLRKICRRWWKGIRVGGFHKLQGCCVILPFLAPAQGFPQRQQQCCKSKGGRHMGNRPLFLLFLLSHCSGADSIRF